MMKKPGVRLKRRFYGTIDGNIRGAYGLSRIRLISRDS